MNRRARNSSPEGDSSHETRAARPAAERLRPELGDLLGPDAVVLLDRRLKYSMEVEEE